MEAEHAARLIGWRVCGVYDRLDGGLNVRLLFILGVGDVLRVNEDASGHRRMNEATFEKFIRVTRLPIFGQLVAFGTRTDDIFLLHPAEMVTASVFTLTELRNNNLTVVALKPLLTVTRVRPDRIFTLATIETWMRQTRVSIDILVPELIRLCNILEDFSGLLVTAALLNTLALHVSLLHLLEHVVCAAAAAQDLTGISSVEEDF